MPDLIPVTDETTRAEMADLLAMANRDTKRLPCVVGSREFPTPWDDAHEFLNELLDDWQAAPA